MLQVLNTLCTHQLTSYVCTVCMYCTYMYVMCVSCAPIVVLMIVGSSVNASRIPRPVPMVSVLLSVSLSLS